MSGAEAVGIFALVCNILQTIELGSKAASISKTIYETGSPDPKEDIVNEQLRGVLESLQASLGTIQAGQSQTRTEDERRLAQISKDTLATAEQLKSISEKIAAAQGKKLESFKLGLHRVLKKGNVYRLDKRLQKQKEALETGLLFRICTQNDALKIQTSTRFEDLSEALKAFVTEISTCQTDWDSLAEAISNSQNDLGQLVKASATETESRVIQRVAELDTSLVDRARQEKILKSLKVQKLNSRRNQIDRPHGSTFAWIFQPELPGPDHPRQMQPNPFLRWHQDITAKVFWMNGKAGSGKSTLMKHLVDSRDTQRLLDSTSPNTLVLSHFLWGGGTPEERSVKNILCSLLHQILSTHPRVISFISTRYPNTKDESDDWSPQELQDSILETVEILNRPVCIFIDGLDEIGKDGPDKLLTLIDALLGDRHIRLCVSSRPDPAFQKRFGEGRVPSLRIQEFTRSDIKSLAEDKITSLFGSKTFHKELSDAICAKANGVFLWVSLALKAVGDGAVRDDDQRALMGRLEALPGDLKDLYQQMWDRENGDNEFYREDAALWLDIMLEGEDIVPERRLSVWHFLLVRNTESLDKIFNSSAPLEQAKAMSLEVLVAKRQLQVRCAGLLEVREDKETGLPIVSFIHRSAKEFLMNSEKSILGFDKTTPDFRKFALLKSSIVIPSKYRERYAPLCATCGERPCSQGCESETDYFETGEHSSNVQAQANITMPDHVGFCQHLLKLKYRGILDAESAVMLLKYTRKMYDQTDQAHWHWHCDFVALAASIGMWEYIYALMEDFEASSPGGKISTAYSSYLFSASFGIPGAYNYYSHSTSEDQMKTARRMLDSGINVRDKFVGSRYFGSRKLRKGKPRLAMRASPQMLATIRLIHHGSEIRKLHPSMKVLASLVSCGHGLDEKTVVKLRWRADGSKFYICTVDTPSAYMSYLDKFCLIEVNTIFLLRLLLTAAADYYKMGTDQLLMPAPTTEFKRQRRDDFNENGSPCEQHKSAKGEAIEPKPGKAEAAADETDKLGTDELKPSTLWKDEGEAEEMTAAVGVESAGQNARLRSQIPDPAAARRQILRDLADAIRQGSGGLRPFFALMASGLEDGEKLSLASLTANDREYLSEGLREAYPHTSSFGVHGEGLVMFKFPLLRTRLQEVMGRVKWESLAEHELHERLKLVENGYYVHPDDEICMVPRPF